MSLKVIKAIIVLLGFVTSGAVGFVLLPGLPLWQIGLVVYYWVLAFAAGLVYGMDDE